MDRIESIATFAEVAERGSFSAAAARLNRSPAAVTRAVAELEARLGVRLLNRTTRAVSLTDAGQRFLSGAKRVLADLAEIEQGTAGQGKAPRGELNVTAPIVFGRRHVLPLVQAFLARFPDVSVRLALLDRPVDLVEEGLDVAIRIGELPSSSAIATRVGAVRRLVVASPSYLKRRGRPRAPGELAKHDVIAFGGLESLERRLFRNKGLTIDAAIKPRLSVNTAEAALDAAAAGFGLTRVLSYQAADALSTGALVRVLADHEDPEIPIHLLYPQGKYPAPKLRAFLDAVVPRLRQTCDAVARSIDPATTR
jgi:DNA-binding transcriptional LysR family regulator